MSPYELSYAAPEDPLFRRLLIRMIEDLSGRRRLLPVYRQWSAEIAGKHPLMWSTVLDMIGTIFMSRRRRIGTCARPPGRLS